MVNAKSFPIYKRFCRPLNTARAERLMPLATSLAAACRAAPALALAGMASVRSTCWAARWASLLETVLGHEAEADVRDVVGAGDAAGEGLTLKRLYGHDAHIVGPGLDGLAHAGHGAGAAHPHGDGVHQAGTLPGDVLQDGRAGDPAVILRVVVVGQPVGVVPAVGGGGLCGHGTGPGQPAAGGAVLDLCSQTQQVFLPQSGGILRHHQHHRVPGGKPCQRQGSGKGAGRGFNDGLAGLQLFLFDGQRQHPFGQTVASRAGGTGKIQIRIQASLQPAGCGVAPQLHDGAGGERLIKVRVDRHGKPPFGKMTLPTQG